jgi:outer membrane protein OmpU
MNNLKKIGLSALAGSLVAISANAADISVSGGVELTYVDTGGNTGNEVTGNSFGANSGLTFTGSGDVGFGTVSMTRAINDANTGWGSSFQTLDMGDMGTLSFDSTGGALVGITANDDLLPTAYEESWTGTTGSGISGVGSTNVIGYTNTYAGVSISAGFNQGASAALGESTSGGQGGHGHIADVYLSMSPYEGLTVGVGQAHNTGADFNALTKTTVESVLNANYAMGPVSVGYRMAEQEDGAAATASHDIEGYSIAFNVNDSFAVSYGEQENEQKAIGAVAAVTEDVKGVSAAYTIGAASIRVAHSEADNDNFVTAVDDETTEISLALSF